ncbi:MAG: hypothetical protein P4M08_12185 [Oligoflexia bacterium]|nr:hypothetical protein [Oligoflexia bacterium]
MRLWRNVSDFLYRTQRESEKLGNLPSVLSKVLLFVFIALFMGIAAVKVVFPKIVAWDLAKPSIVIKPLQWKLLLPQFPVSVGSRALSGPPHELWASSLTRADPRYRDIVAKVPRGMPIWIGTVIDPITLKQALSLRANHFIIGRINGVYQIYIDGDLVTEGDYESIDTAKLAFSFSRLKAEQPIEIAIRIVPEPGNPFPDFFNGTGGEGFATEANARLIALNDWTWAISKPGSLSLVYFCLSCVFFTLWLCSVGKQEFSYMAIWCLILSAIQLRYFGILSRSIGAELSYSFDLVLRVAEGTFGAFAALSFARARRSWFTYGIPPLLLFGALIGFGVTDPERKLFLSQQVGIFFVSPAYALGGMVCLVQSFALARASSASGAMKGRIVKLFSYGLMMLILSGIYQVGAWNILSPAVATFHRIAPLFLVQLLTAIMLLEYHKHEKAIRESPATRYHLNGTIDRPLEVILFQFDMKSSQGLAAQLAAGAAEAGRMSNRKAVKKSGYSLLSYSWYLEVERLATSMGGEVLSDEGDLLLISFDFEKNKDPLKAVYLMTQQFPGIHRELEKRLGLRSRIEIRGSVILATDLKAVWKPTGSKVRPGFEGDCLVESKRLMDTEKSIPGGDERTRILFADALFDGKLDDSEDLLELRSHPTVNATDEKGTVRLFKVVEPRNFIPRVQSERKIA